MSLRVFRKTLFSADLVANADQVIADAPIPSESSQNNVWGQVHLVSTEAAAAPLTRATIWGLEGWVIPLSDPDTTKTLDFIWDSMVGKDVDVASGIFDIDVGGAVTAAFMDIGEIDLEQLIGMSAMPLKNQWLFRRGLMSFANTGTGLLAGTPDTYVPRALINIRSGKKINAETPSMSLVAAAIPHITDVDTSRASPVSEAIWLQMQYAELTLEQAFVFLVGQIEAGAETPWDIAAANIQEFIEPEYVELGSGAEIESNDMSCFSQFTFDITVPGRKEFNVITGGR